MGCGRRRAVARLLDRLFHACTFGLGHLLAPGTPVPAGGHLSAPTETSPTSAAPVSRRETGAAPRYANTASPNLSAQRSQVPGELGPGGQGSELRHYKDGHFEHAAGAVPPAAGDVVEVEPPRALAVGLAPPAFQELLTLSVSTSGGSTRSSASHRTSTACVLVYCIHRALIVHCRAL